MLIFDITDEIRAYVQGFGFGLEYLWLIFLAIGIVCLLGYFIARNIKKVQVDSTQGTERPQTAEEFLNEGKGENPPEKSLKRKFDGNGLSTAFADALNEKLHETIMGAKVKLNMKAPIRVRNDQMFVDVEDGEIGEIVISVDEERAKEPAPASEIAS